MSKELLELLECLNVKQISENTFLGQQATTFAPRTFGGQLMAHAIMTTGRSLPQTLPVHSLSAHFIRGGNTKEPIIYEVSILRENKKYANTQVNAFQKGELLFTALVAFNANVEEKIEHNIAMPQVPAPEELPELATWFPGYEKYIPIFIAEPKRIDWRYVNDPCWIQHTKNEFVDYNQVWVKPMGSLPADPLIHSAVCAFSSDTTILDSVLTRSKFSWGMDRVIAYTVNQTMWFHEPIDFNHFHLYATASEVALGGRALSSGYYFDPQTERAVVSVSQECALRSFNTKP